MIFLTCIFVIIWISIYNIVVLITNLIILNSMETQEQLDKVLPTNEIQDIENFIKQILVRFSQMTDKHVFPLMSMQMLFFFLALMTIWEICKWINAGIWAIVQKKEQKKEEQPRKQSLMSNILIGSISFICICWLNYLAPESMAMVKSWSFQMLNKVFIILSVLMVIVLSTVNFYLEKADYYEKLMEKAGKKDSKSKYFYLLYLLVLTFLILVIENIYTDYKNGANIMIKILQSIWAIYLIKCSPNKGFYSLFAIIVIISPIVYAFYHEIHNYLEEQHLPTLHSLKNIMVLFEIFLLYFYLYGIMFKDLLERNKMSLHLLHFFIIYKLLFFVKVSIFFILSGIVFIPFLVEMSKGFLIYSNQKQSNRVQAETQQQYYRALRQSLQQLFILLVCILVPLIYEEYYNNILIKCFFIALMIPPVTQIYKRSLLSQDLTNFFKGQIRHKSIQKQSNQSLLKDILGMFKEQEAKLYMTEFILLWVVIGVHDRCRFVIS